MSIPSERWNFYSILIVNRKNYPNVSKIFVVKVVDSTQQFGIGPSGDCSYSVRVKYPVNESQAQNILPCVA
ncbi:Protein-arginine N-acetylglucosaminyltransferase NleB [Trichinella pseudospiralis]